MGKSITSTTATGLVNLSKHMKPPPKYVRPAPNVLAEGEDNKKKKKKAMETSNKGNNINFGSLVDNSNLGSGSSLRVPLGEVVSDCVKRWFKDTLKEAKAGDVNMQVLVAQMYYSGYGIPRDAQKGRIWMIRASRMRSSVWKVSDKHPGYNASDSDSDEMKQQLLDSGPSNS